LNDVALSRVAGIALPPCLADLVDIAIAAYAADRLFLRPRVGQDFRAPNWRRQMALELPLRCAELWERVDIRHEVSEVLEEFTGDQWRLIPRKHCGLRRISECETYLFGADLPKPIAVSLFSGGLDSFAGSVGWPWPENTGVP